jgi:hypothetical protein
MPTRVPEQWKADLDGSLWPTEKLAKQRDAALLLLEKVAESVNYDRDDYNGVVYDVILHLSAHYTITPRKTTPKIEPTPPNPLTTAA